MEYDWPASRVVIENQRSSRPAGVVQQVSCSYYKSQNALGVIITSLVYHCYFIFKCKNKVTVGIWFRRLQVKERNTTFITIEFVSRFCLNLKFNFLCGSFEVIFCIALSFSCSIFRVKQNLSLLHLEERFFFPRNINVGLRQVFHFGPVLVLVWHPCVRGSQVWRGRSDMSPPRWQAERP